MLMASAEPDVTCYGPEYITPKERNCEELLDQMPTTTAEMTFGNMEDPHVEAGLPRVFQTRMCCFPGMHLLESFVGLVKLICHRRLHNRCLDRWTSDNS